MPDAQNIAASDAVLLIMGRADVVAGINCGVCGYTTCYSMAAECKKRGPEKSIFPAPNCAIRLTDMNIVVGAAIKTARFKMLIIGLCIATAWRHSATEKDIFF